MTMDALAGQVEAAVLAMYFGHTQTATQEAINWLLRFDASPSAWAVLPLLLQSSRTEVRYYAANGLYSKVRTEWHSLSEGQKGEGNAALWGALMRGGTGDWVAGKRLCLALATAAVQTEGGVPTLLTRTGELLVAPRDASSTYRSLMVAELLACISDMCDSLQLSPRRRADVDGDVASSAPGVLAMIASMLREGPLAVGPGLDAAAWSGVGRALEAAASWVAAADLGLDARSGPSLPHAQLIGAVTGCLAEAAPPAVCSAAAGLVEALYRLSAEPVQSARDAASAALSSTILAVGPATVAAARAGAGGAMDVAAALARVLAVLFGDEDWAVVRGASWPLPSTLPPPSSFPFVAAALANAGGSAIGGEVVGVGVLLGDLLLQLTCLPSVPVLDAAMEGAASIHMTQSSDRHPYFRAPFAGQQAMALTSISVGEGGPWSGSGDAVAGLRERGVADGLGDAFGAIGTGVVGAIMPLVGGREGCGALSAGLHPSSLAAPPAARCEAVLFALTACCGPGGSGGLPEALAEGEGEDGAGGGDPAACESLLSLLLQCTRAGFSLPVPLSCATSKLLSALRRWFSAFTEGGLVRIGGGGGESFTLLPGGHFLSSAASFLLSAMAAGGGGPGPGVGDAELFLTGMRGGVPAGSADEEEGEDGPAALDGGSSPSACAAIAFGRLVVACPPLSTLQGGAILSGAVRALEEGAGRGLGLAPRSAALEGLLSSTTRALLSREQWQALATAALGPACARLQAASAALAGAGVPVSPSHPALRCVVVDLSVISHLLAMTPLCEEGEEGEGEGAWLGASAPSAPHVLLLLCAPTLTALERSLLPARSCSSATIVLLYAARAALRAFPIVSLPRLPTLISLCADTYGATGVGAALTTIEHALGMLLQGGGGDWAGAVSGVVASVTASSERVEGASLGPFFSLLCSCLAACPRGVEAAGGAVLTASVALLAPAFASGERDAGRRAAEWVRACLGEGEGRAALREAVLNAAGILGGALVSTLTGIGSESNVSSAIDLFALLTRQGGGLGEAVLQAVVRAVGDAYSAAAGGYIKGASEETGARAAASERLARGSPLEPSGPLSLSLSEHVSLLTGAAGMAGSSSGRPSPQLRLALAEYSKVCRHESTRY